MSFLKGKNILLGVSGGIAAYKSTFLVRLCIKSAAKVRVILTPDAEEFVTPLSLSTLSKNPVISSFYNEEKTWYNHVKLGEWADLMIIAPATANTISKMVAGHSNNFLLTTYLSAKCPVFVVPAMDLDMYKHQSTQDNLTTLTSYGNKVIPVGSGELASGLSGKGRMAEPEEIIDFIENHFQEQSPLHNKTFLITAGPTYEPIDPVRFIGNHSSGKMGMQIAKAALHLGAKVKLVLGPSAEFYEHTNLEILKVQTAQQMLDACLSIFNQVDVAIATAAVSDYRPAQVVDQKIKKKDETLTLELIKNPDILKTLGAKKTNQLLVGFALETQNEEENAIQKLSNKNLDFIVLNSMNNDGAGFQHNTNKITILADNYKKEFDLKTKSEVASDILTEILQRIA
ncbi:bifunctional phosphopantothenoylcysteine decarboxylase/phosphopantothenate--cysteine ligase CoaBC [Psychroflexus planctonicus]|uniref:Coenzyme A biosynthesis bifunctional protein CoaBC n=1 Tax=Psychroflexus planctonicus TaxID=1526575 RepID=A0ABQ1SH74_9FLAO|nr:bifunctional phosphopantothenoylcysteine decarboxylase/phosphopantothenate--cysteine ligase CoaBC [Psychroflexus planctonicus]GGE30569.1 phosphopantothenoylcysteine decarboxylase [Psychroflexus planctonicus]